MPRPSKAMSAAEYSKVASIVVQEVFAEFYRLGTPLGMEVMTAIITAVNKKVADLNSPKSETVEVVL